MKVHHVLVVDDEPHISRIIRTRLEQGPFHVTVAENGPDALEAVKSIPDLGLVILDLMLPGMSGLDVLQKLRSTERWKELPCIVLTAAGQDSHYKTALELGATEFMTKPFSPRRLLARALTLSGETSSITPETSDAT